MLVDRSQGDQCLLDQSLPNRSCGSMLVTEMVWIRPRGRVDSEMGIEKEQQIRKNGQREGARAYVQGLVEGEKKEKEKIDYLNKRDDRIDELMWVFCKNRCVKQKKQVFSVKIDV